VTRVAKGYDIEFRIGKEAKIYTQNLEIPD